jgi:peptidoglycan-N-acetylglucosamine deacetylase
MRLFRPCFIAGWLYPDAIFRIRTTEKLLYLTFDDGPCPDSTPQLLDILDKYSIKALFFCDGKAAENQTDLITLMTSRGHLIGNHGYHHHDGWITSLNKYADDVINAAPFTSSVIFRPPYGRMRINQYRKLRETYKIVLWDIMPYDFDTSFGSANSLRVLKNKIRPGSIIVLHDTPDSGANNILDEFLTFAIRSDYRFELPNFCPAPEQDYPRNDSASANTFSKQ